MEVINLNENLKYVAMSELERIAFLESVDIKHFKTETCRGWLYVYGTDIQIRDFLDAAEAQNFLAYDPLKQLDSDEDI